MKFSYLGRLYVDLFLIKAIVGFAKFYQIFATIHFLMILTGKHCVLLNLLQEFIEIEAWVLLRPSYVHKVNCPVRS